jgi:hypothetical protein
MPKFYYIVDDGYSRSKIWLNASTNNIDDANTIAKAAVIIHFSFDDDMFYRLCNWRCISSARRILQRFENANLEELNYYAKKNIISSRDTIPSIRIICPR